MRYRKIMYIFITFLIPLTHQMAIAALCDEGCYLDTHFVREKNSDVVHMFYDGAVTYQDKKIASIWHAKSSNKGASWTQYHDYSDSHSSLNDPTANYAVISGIAYYTGNGWTSRYDPYATVGSDGTIYVSYAMSSQNREIPTYDDGAATVIAYSTNNGGTWNYKYSGGALKLATKHRMYVDKPDPNDTATWTNIVEGSADDQLIIELSNGILLYASANGFNPNFNYNPPTPPDFQYGWQSSADGGMYKAYFDDNLDSYSEIYYDQSYFDHDHIYLTDDLATTYGYKLSVSPSSIVQMSNGKLYASGSATTTHLWGGDAILLESNDNGNTWNFNSFNYIGNPTRQNELPKLFTNLAKTKLYAVKQIDYSGLVTVELWMLDEEAEFVFMDYIIRDVYGANNVTPIVFTDGTAKLFYTYDTGSGLVPDSEDMKIDIAVSHPKESDYPEPYNVVKGQSLNVRFIADTDQAGQSYEFFSFDQSNPPSATYLGLNWAVQTYLDRNIDIVFPSSSSYSVGNEYDIMVDSVWARDYTPNPIFGFGRVTVSDAQINSPSDGDEIVPTNDTTSLTVNYFANTTPGGTVYDIYLVNVVTGTETFLQQHWAPDTVQNRSTNVTIPDSQNAEGEYKIKVESLWRKQNPQTGPPIYAYSLGTFDLKNVRVNTANDDVTWSKNQYHTIQYTANTTLAGPSYDILLIGVDNDNVYELELGWWADSSVKHRTLQSFIPSSVENGKYRLRVDSLWLKQNLQYGGKAFDDSNGVITITN